MGTVAALVKEAVQAQLRGDGQSGESMFRYEVLRGNGNGRATMVVAGNAVFTHSKEVEEALCEALDGCDHLTVDVGAAADLDLTFRVLLCSLHRRSELINKTISVRDARGGGRRGIESRHARVEGCLFKDGSEFCSLWRG